MGARPPEEIRHFILDGSFEGHEYHYKLALAVGQSGAAAAPNNKKFDPLNIPRVRGSDDAETDLGWTLRFYEESPEYRYVSDGDPNRISVPEEYKDNVNLDSLGDKELYVYSVES